MKRKMVLEDGREVNLQLWDTAGQERFQSLCTSFYRGADCCIIVYDVSSEQSYANIQRWKAAFSNATQVEGVPFVLIGNKLDLGTRVNAQKVQTEWIDSGKAHDHIQASALTNSNVDLAFMKVATLAMKFQHNNSLPKSGDGILESGDTGKAESTVVLLKKPETKPKLNYYCC